MSQSNFFDAIGVADMEKVHSAVIGWMLSDKCNAFGTGPKGLDIRSELLNKIFGIENSLDKYDTIDSYIEWKNIDIFVVTSQGKEKKCWVIENKIKSSQHSSQLNRYVEIIEQSFPQCKRKYCFLTLINEEPEMEWERCTYSQLQTYVSQALTLCCPQNKDYPFVSEYVNCISKLSQALSTFINHPEEYRNVFEDGSKKKEVKSSVGMSDTAKYICDNGLETIFQKCFLSRIIPSEIKINDSFRIGETFGTALVEYHYAKSDEAILAFQFQNGTFKVQVSRPNPKDRNETKEAVFIETWLSRLSKYCEGGRWRLNQHKKNNPPYYSISSSHIFWSDSDYIGNKHWYENETDFIKEQWKRAHQICVTILNELKGNL